MMLLLHAQMTKASRNSSCWNMALHVPPLLRCCYLTFFHLFFYVNQFICCLLNVLPQYDVRMKYLHPKTAQITRNSNQKYPPPPHTHTHTKPVEKQGKLRDDCLAWVHLARGWIIVKWSSWPCIRAVWKYLWQSNAIVGAKMRSRVVSGWVQESREQDLACLL